MLVRNKFVSKQATRNIYELGTRRIENLVEEDAAENVSPKPIKIINENLRQIALQSESPTRISSDVFFNPVAPDGKRGTF